MTEVAHTPGPWSIDLPKIKSPVGINVAEVSIAYKASVEFAANARLIAAAPDLFSACVPSDLDDAADIVESENRFLAGELRKQARAQRAAISKALGAA